MLTILEKELIFSSCPEFAACHASTIEKCADGSLCAAWFGGTKESHPDVDIFVSRRDASGWSVPARVARFPEACWNPVLFRIDTRLLLFFKVGKDTECWRTYITESTDAGRHWSEPKELVPGDVGGRGPVKNKPIRLKDGRIVAGASIEKAGLWDCFTDVSFDNGITWQASPFVPIDHQETGRADGIIQPTLWEDAAGLSMLARSTRGYLYYSHSSDGGLTWSKAVETAIPNNNSGVDLVKLSDGRLFLAATPISGNWASREKMACALSSGDLRFDDFLVLDHDTGKEFAYPAVIADGRDLYLTYTYARQTIRYYHLRVE